jgi:CRISPR/Cas system-associated exonuclease Cas4 (RecB family)
MPDAELRESAKADSQPFPKFPLQDVIAGLMGGVFPPRFVRANRPRDRIYASELGSCRRAVWRNWRNPKPHDVAFERGRGALGHAVEDLIAKHLAPIIVAREVSFTNDIVSGRADFFIRLPTGEQVPVEVKSTYGFDLAIKDPKPSHFLQLSYYSMSADSPFGLLIYVNLSNWGGQSGEWVALKVPRMDREVETRARYLRMLVQTPNEPECENPDDCWDCEHTNGESG